MHVPGGSTLTNALQNSLQIYFSLETAMVILKRVCRINTYLRPHELNLNDYLRNTTTWTGNRTSLGSLNCSAHSIATWASFAVAAAVGIATVLQISLEVLR